MSETEDAASTWTLTFRVPEAALPVFETFLESFAGAHFVDGPDGEGRVPVTAYLSEKPDDDAVRRWLADAAAAAGVETPDFTFERLPETDWVAETEKTLPAIRVRRIYLYGAHIRTKPPAGAIALNVEAGLAFGTGRHESTFGCLMALQDLAKRRIGVARALDMGCGSGVLAMAIARLWGAQVLAVDNDPMSVETAADNAVKNRVGHLVTAVLGEGYAGPDVSGHGPYDLVAANILADPLIAMAPNLAQQVTPGGHAVLSGILAKQAPRVQAAHVTQGLSVRRRYVFGDWATLVMRKR